MVWGGVTGHRQSWLKEAGWRVEFNSVVEAARCAARLERQTNGNLHRTANFRYTVRPIPERETTR
jgi:hypothetical protein